MSVTIHEAIYCCNNCKKNCDDSIQIFTEQDELIKYANPKNTSCITKVYCCQHINFDKKEITNEVIILQTCPKINDYLVLNKEHLQNYGLFRYFSTLKINGEEINCYQINVLKKYYVMGKYCNICDLANNTVVLLTDNFDNFELKINILCKYSTKFPMDQLLGDYYIIKRNGSLIKGAIK